MPGKDLSDHINTPKNPYCIYKHVLLGMKYNILFHKLYSVNKIFYSGKVSKFEQATTKEPIAMSKVLNMRPAKISDCSKRLIQPSDLAGLPDRADHHELGLPHSEGPAHGRADCQAAGEMRLSMQR